MILTVKFELRANKTNKKVSDYYSCLNESQYSIQNAQIGDTINLSQLLIMEYGSYARFYDTHCITVCKCIEISQFGKE